MTSKVAILIAALILSISPVLAQDVPSNRNIIVTTTPDIDGYKIVEYKGVVRGMVVRQPTIMQGFKANIKSIVGGTMNSLNQMCEQARSQAYEMMLAKAAEVGANAVVGMHYDSTAFNSSSSDMGCEIVAYGTAVRIQPR